MGQTKIVITGAGSTQEIELNPRGLLLGRAETCDVVLGADSVSRQHARISQDPFGRWIIEDLGSQNGTLINGQRIQAQAMLPGQNIEMGTFSLEMLVAEEPASPSSVAATVNIMDEAVVSYGEDKAAHLSPVLVQHLNELSSSLMQVTRPADLYAQACQCLASLLNTLVAVVRLPCSPAALPKSPDVLACSFGQDTDDQPVLQSSSIHLSRRTLDAARSTDAPVMATSGGSGEGQQNMHLTIMDEQKPHVVFAVSVNVDEPGQMTEVLYVDMFESQTSEATLDFIEVVARHINFAQKHLLFAELQKQEQALRAANALLEKKDRIKDEYVARITHDIKGHLGAIANCLYVASTDMPEDRTNLAEFVGRAQGRTERCTDFVLDLLHLTRMRLGGRIEMNSFSLPDCLARVIEDNAGRAQDKSIDLSCQVDPQVDEIIGNELSLHEVLGNLVSNAVKYSPEGSKAAVRVTALDQGVQVEVADTGIGIPQSDLEHVFDEFFRASNAVSGKEEGTGLGLSIVKQIVDSHNGQIRATSQEGQGTTFILELPLDARGAWE